MENKNDKCLRSSACASSFQIAFQIRRFKLFIFFPIVCHKLLRRSMFIIQLLLYFFVFYVYYSFSSLVENLNSFFSTFYAFVLFVCIVCFHEIFVWLSTVSFTFAGSRIGFSCHSPYNLSAKWFALVCICELDSLVLSSRSSVCGDSFNCQTG